MVCLVGVASHRLSLSAAGVLSSTGCPGTPTAQEGSYNFTVQVKDSAGNVSTPQPLTLAVQCPPAAQPNVALFFGGKSASGLPTWVRATFGSQYCTLSDYATACGFTGFDWIQYIDLSPPNLRAQNGATYTAPPSYNDSPPGGWAYEFQAPDYQWLKTHQPNFANSFPFYYSPLDIHPYPPYCATGPEGSATYLSKAMTILSFTSLIVLVIPLASLTTLALR